MKVPRALDRLYPGILSPSSELQPPLGWDVIATQQHHTPPFFTKSSWGTPRWRVMNKGGLAQQPGGKAELIARRPRTAGRVIGEKNPLTLVRSLWECIDQGLDSQRHLNTIEGLGPQAEFLFGEVGGGTTHVYVKKLHLLTPGLNMTSWLRPASP
ncbi:transmembrane protein 2-like [Platysternon megacephalum]|uniref:Transmembrane protein 2-like n=1 Tax=Platysternon megacephalum TaxID=55544 RepID=A0A4D9EY96_9SAUR|nr:transmembrane protein 2-like [Platysternon megacephalum]